MRNKYKIAVLGGDLRQYAVAKELNKSGAEVYTYGLSAQVEDESKIKVCEEVSEAVGTADAVILPLPSSTDGNLLNCPALRSSERITLDTVVARMDDKAILFAVAEQRFLHAVLGVAVDVLKLIVVAHFDGLFALEDG